MFQGARIRLRDRGHRLPERAQGQRQRIVRGAAYDSQCGTFHIRRHFSGRNGRPCSSWRWDGDGRSCCFREKPGWRTLIARQPTSARSREAIIQVRGLTNRFGKQLGARQAGSRRPSRRDPRRHRWIRFGQIGPAALHRRFCTKRLSGSVRILGYGSCSLARRPSSVSPLEQLLRCAFPARRVVFLSDRRGKHRCSRSSKMPASPGPMPSTWRIVKRASGRPAGECSCEISLASLSGRHDQAGGVWRARLRWTPISSFSTSPPRGSIRSARRNSISSSSPCAMLLGLTVFIVTHDDLDTLYTICDRVAVLSQKTRNGSKRSKPSRTNGYRSIFTDRGDAPPAMRRRRRPRWSSTPGPWPCRSELGASPRTC